MTRGRPRIRTPEESRLRRNQQKRIERWRRHFAQLKLERGCADCDRAVEKHPARLIHPDTGAALDPDFAICESCDRII